MSGRINVRLNAEWVLLLTKTSFGGLVVASCRVWVKVSLKEDGPSLFARRAAWGCTSGDEIRIGCQWLS